VEIRPGRFKRHKPRRGLGRGRQSPNVPGNWICLTGRRDNKSREGEGAVFQLVSATISIASCTIWSCSFKSLRTFNLPASSQAPCLLFAMRQILGRKNHQKMPLQEKGSPKPGRSSPQSDASDDRVSPFDSKFNPAGSVSVSM
jgi:hypothetical protein